MKDVVVIGAGLGGIAAAARLARQGCRVTVVERRSRPGGRCDVFERDGFRFDMGPTLFLMPAVFEETFDAVGEKLTDWIRLVRLDPTYRVHFHDGSSIDLTGDLVRMRTQLEAIEPGSFSGYLRFLESGREFYELSLERFVGRNFYTFWDHFSPANLALMLRMKALTSHFGHVSKYFHDPRLRAALSFQNMYLGLSPHDAPATYSLLQYTELAEGVWFPEGGMYRLIEALVRVAEKLGVRFLYDSPVEAIETSDRRVDLVRRENGEPLAADLVLANADLPYVYESLLPDDGSAVRLARMRYSSSTLMFYWGVRGEAPSSLLHHNVFLADHRYRESFDRIFRDLTLPDDPSFYVNVPSMTDRSFAPEGFHSLMVLVPVGHLDERNSQDWPALRARARECVLAGLANIGVSDLESKIVMEETLGPPQYRHSYNLAKGAAFGLGHDFWQVGYLRPHNRHKRYENLYFVGAGTHPGTGLPMVLLSARLVVERMAKEQGLSGVGAE